MRIINDLVGFCHIEGANEFQIFVSQDKKNKLSTIRVSCSIPNLSPESIDELTNKLNLPRQREVEQNYWSLSGESEMSVELTLIGMMIDKASVNYQNGVLDISVSRTD